MSTNYRLLINRRVSIIQPFSHSSPPGESHVLKCVWTFSHSMFISHISVSCSFHPQIKWFQRGEFVTVCVKLINPVMQKCEFNSDTVIYRSHDYTVFRHFTVGRSVWHNAVFLSVMKKPDVFLSSLYGVLWGFFDAFWSQWVREWPPLLRKAWAVRWHHRREVLMGNQVQWARDEADEEGQAGLEDAPQTQGISLSFRAFSIRQSCRIVWNQTEADDLHWMIFKLSPQSAFVSYEFDYIDEARVSPVNGEEWMCLIGLTLNSSVLPKSIKCHFFLVVLMKYNWFPWSSNDKMTRFMKGI